MLTQVSNAIVELKTQGHKDLYHAEYKGWSLILRPLTFGEYKAITELEKYTTPVDTNDMIVRVCGLFVRGPNGEDKEYLLDRGPAIFPDVIAQAVLDVSGFDSKQTFAKVLEEKRQEASTLPSMIQIYICAVFHTLGPDDVDNMTLSEQLDLFAKAETLLGQQIDTDKLLGKVSKRPGLPVPPGMQSTHDLLSPDIADLPEFPKNLR